MAEKMTDNNAKVYEGLTARQQLNLFRNLYYNEGNATEKGIIANAINDILPQFNRQKAEIERLMQKLQQPQAVKCKDNEVKCKDCEYLMFSDMYGECSKCYKGIVNPNDSCGKGKLRKGRTKNDKERT